MKTHLPPSLPPAVSPEDTIGPFYPYPFLDGDRHDLARVHAGLAVRPAGTPIQLSGRILDGKSELVRPALLEFWQANAAGRLRSPLNDGDPALDPFFDGYGRYYTTDGRFAIATIKPGRVRPASADDCKRAPYVSVQLLCDGVSRVVTQLFFDDEPHNERDPLLASLPAALRSRLVARRTGQRNGVACYELDIVLQGERETPFFDDLCDGATPDGYGRKIVPGPTDLTAEVRVPASRLRAIPAVVRHSFVPYDPVVPGLRPGENDLTRIAPGRPRAAGETLYVAGCVRNRNGRALPAVLVELWNANRWGRYTHVDDPATEPLDPNFLGHGRTLTGADGRYAFWTVKPAPYLARPDIGRWRPAHLHFSLRGGTVRIVTQMYFPGDPHNETDPMFSLLGDARGTALGREVPAPPGADCAFRFDIVVPGANATYFD